MNQQQVDRFHEEVKGRYLGYKIPDDLKVLCNQEFRGYLDGQDNSRYFQWLPMAIKILKPQIVLELGTNVGASSIAMFSAIETETELITIDIMDNARFVPEAMRNSKNVHLIIGDDLDSSLIHKYSRSLYEYIYGKVDFLFIDTEHWAKQLKAEWEIYSRFLAPGALVIFDDINVNDMREVWDSFQYPKKDISVDCHHSGFGIMSYNP